MKRIILSVLIFIIALLPIQLFSQMNLRNDKANALLIHLNYQAQMPLGNMASRFGFSNMVGVGFDYKVKNWTIGICGNFLFGNKVKGDVIAAIRTKEGYIINTDGVPADVLLYERGWKTGLEFGRLVSFKKPNPNSGLLFKLGLGYLQHKITINSNVKQMPQLDKTYRKGYDRLTGGFYLSQFIGYMYLDPKKFVNFYVGIELHEGFTKGYRPWQFDIDAPDNKSRFDGFAAIKIGWIIPVYRKEKVEQFYYN